MTQAAATANAYLRTKVLTARPEQLRLMLLEGAVRFARQGRDGLVASNFEQAFTGFSRAREIVIELMNSMRPDVDRELCERVSSLYLFIYMKIVEGSHEKDVEKIDRAIELLDYERETWAMLMQQLAAADSRTDQAVAGAAGTERTPLCVRG